MESKYNKLDWNVNKGIEFDKMFIIKWFKGGIISVILIGASKVRVFMGFFGIRNVS